MANWKIVSLKSRKEDGVISQITYQCVVENEGGSARKIGEISINIADANSEDFIPYDNVMESDVISWLYQELGSEKENIEAELALKIADRVQRRAAGQFNNGTPWQ